MPEANIENEILHYRKISIKKTQKYLVISTLKRQKLINQESKITFSKMACIIGH